MKTIIKYSVSLIALLCFFINNILAQTIIDYQTWTTYTGCNIFSSSTNVPAKLDGAATIIAHLSNIGQPQYDATDAAVSISCNPNYNPNSSFKDYNGTQYQITYNFKQNYTYVIKINARCINGSTANLVIEPTNTGLGGSPQCLGTALISGSTSGNQIQNSVMTGGTTFTDYTYPTISVPATGTLRIAAVPPTTGGTQTILIRKITITETPPAVSFNITPVAVPIQCGNTTPKTFTINTGGTNYTWNLGTTPNNWLYNGVAAPATVSTGTTNTITLTPVCGTTPKNISATVTANATNYNTNTSTVSITPPAMSIDNNNPICTSQNYPITGFPSCNATVVWSASPTGIVTPNTSTSAAPTFTRVTNGNITLTATVTACGTVQPALTKTIRVGTFSQADYPITGPSSTTCGTLVTYSVPQLSSSPTYTWMYQGSPWQYQGGQGTRILQMRAPTSTSGGVFSVHVDNACGIGPSASKTTSVSCSFAPIDLFQVLPNPATNEVTVTANSISTTSFTELNIFNQHGVLKKTQKFAKVKKGTINVSSLPTGIYFIEIFDGVNRLKKQLSIIK